MLTKIPSVSEMNKMKLQAVVHDAMREICLSSFWTWSPTSIGGGNFVVVGAEVRVLISFENVAGSMR